MSTRSKLFLLVVLLWISSGLSALSNVSGTEPVELLNPSTVAMETITPRHSQVRRTQGQPAEIRFVTEPDHDYPGFSVRPEKGVWDLSQTGLIEMKIRNLSDQEIKVMLTLANESNDGRQGVSADQIQVPAGKSRTMQFVLGLWYTNPSDSFDPSRVAVVNVMVQRGADVKTLAVERIVAKSPDDEVRDIFASDYFKNLKPFFGKGLNIGNTLESPKEGEWGGKLLDDHFRVIAEAGFESIRLPVRWSAHASGRAPYPIDASFRRRVKEVVDRALGEKLKVVLNVHHYEEVFEKPESHRDRFLQLWRQIAEEYSDYPPELAFEILNEPHGELDADFWNRLASDTVDIIRRSNPDRWIVIGPADWNSVTGLDQLKLPDDDRIAMTFHYYLPMQLTHQGASWVSEDANRWRGTTWTDTPVQRMQLELAFNRALRYGFDHQVPIYLGEYGTYQEAPLPSRVAWTGAVTEAAVRRKMGYAYWEFYSGFGLFDQATQTWRRDLLEAVVGDLR